MYPPVTGTAAVHSRRDAVVMRNVTNTTDLEQNQNYDGHGGISSMTELDAIMSLS